MPQKHALLFIICFFAGVPTAAAQLLFTNFGADVAVHEDEILVSEPNSRYRAGTVYVFKDGDGSSWSEHQQLTASDGEHYDGFGHSMAISGDRLVVGAPRQKDGHGRVYFFEYRAGDGWVEAGTIDTPDVDPEDAFSSSVAFEGDLVAVGAPGLVSNGPPGHPERSGAVLLFRREGDSWTQVARLSGSATEAAAAFGHKVAVVDGRVFVSAPGQDGHAGAVYEYEDVDGEWTEAAILTGDEVEEGAEFGADMKASLGAIFVGAPGQGDAGAVFVYHRNSEDETWSLVRRLQPLGDPSTAGFGTSIAVAPRGEVWIGAPQVDQIGGATYVFEGDSEFDTLLNVSRLDIEDVQAMDYFGGSVAVGESVAAVGLLGDDDMAGSVAIFEIDQAGTWTNTARVRSEPVGLSPLVGAQRDCEDGEAEVFGCSRVDLLSFLPVQEIGGERGIIVNDLWGWTDPDSDREYVIIGRTNGTSFVDINDPSNPVYLGNLPKTEGSQSAVWRDVKVYRNHAFVVADNAGPHGVQIFDLRQLRDVEDAPVTFSETARYDGIHSAHNIVINEQSGFAYTVGNSGGGETCGGGLHMIDIQVPTQPAFVGCFAHEGTGTQGTGYTHDAQCVIYAGPDETYQGREICLSANETALSIGDVTDKEDVTYISVGTYPNSSYVHQGWLTEDHRYFYINDEGDEVAGLVDETRTLIWDVSDLDDPQLAREYTWGERSSDHNLYVRGNLMYQSNYVSGLRIHDISDPVNPTEVAHFDTVPSGDNGPGFAGSWSNYPFFESGVIAVSSMGEGLFLLRKRSDVGL